MTTQESLEATYKPNEISEMLAAIIDELSISPPCSNTNTFFKIRLSSLIRQNSMNAKVLKMYQSALAEVFKA